MVIVGVVGAATTLVLAVPVAVLSTPFDSTTDSASGPVVAGVLVMLVTPPEPAAVGPVKLPTAHVYTKPERAGAVAVNARPAVAFAATVMTGATAGPATVSVFGVESAPS